MAIPLVLGQRHPWIRLPSPGEEPGGPSSRVDAMQYGRSLSNLRDTRSCPSEADEASTLDHLSRRKNKDGGKQQDRKEGKRHRQKPKCIKNPYLQIPTPINRTFYDFHSHFPGPMIPDPVPFVSDKEESEHHAKGRQRDPSLNIARTIPCNPTPKLRPFDPLFSAVEVCKGHARAREQPSSSQVEDARRKRRTQTQA